MACQACGDPDNQLFDICPKCHWENDSSLEQYAERYEEAVLIQANTPHSTIYDSFQDCGYYVISLPIENELITQYRDWWSSANGNTPDGHLQEITNQ